MTSDHDEPPGATSGHQPSLREAASLAGTLPHPKPVSTGHAPAPSTAPDCLRMDADCYGLAGHHCLSAVSL